MLQSLTHERGGVLVYQTALECVVNTDLREEWTEYLAQTPKHVEVLRNVCIAVGFDPGELTPGCKIVQHTGKSLVVAMKMALAEGDPAAAELVACEAVVLAETKDHADWELIGKCAESLDGRPGKSCRTRTTKSRTRKMNTFTTPKDGAGNWWLKALGLEAALPPAEETRDVNTAAEAAEAVCLSSSQPGWNHTQ